jgi:superfamily II DNA helicase RecQ
MSQPTKSTSSFSHKIAKQKNFIDGVPHDSDSVTAIFFMLLVGIVVVFALLVRWLASGKRTNKYINERGYVVLRAENELEHRYLAKQLLGRELDRQEIVHHINGRRTDNKIENLCLMDRNKHEHFHSWLRWKKEKSGKYPSFRHQKEVLAGEYGGTLLETIKDKRKADEPVRPAIDNNKKTTDSDHSINQDENALQIQGILFNELRKERKRLAFERNIPLYEVFKNMTLKEMSEEMPVSESAMLQITGVSPEKFRLFGDSFLSVIRSFKNKREIKSIIKKNA